MTRIGLLVEGGAQRGIFSAGVLDAFLEENYNPFEVVYGVSAGSTNAAAFIAGMKGRNYRVYTEYNTRKEFMSLPRFLRGGDFMDLDWLWEVTIRDMRLDLEKFDSFKGEFYVGVTDFHTAKPSFMSPTSENLEEVIKASSALPGLYRRPISINGKDYVDGGVTSALPFAAISKHDCDVIVVLRTRTKNYRKTSGNLMFDYLAASGSRKLFHALRTRHKEYNKELDYMRMYRDSVVIEVCPDETIKTKRTTRNIRDLRSDYEMGLRMGEDLVKTLRLIQRKADV